MTRPTLLRDVTPERRAELGVPDPAKPASEAMMQALYRTIGGTTAYFVGKLAVHSRRRAWMANPVCVTCEQPIADVGQAGLVKTPTGDRVACRDECFIAAILGLGTIGALTTTGDTANA